VIGERRLRWNIPHWKLREVDYLTQSWELDISVIQVTRFEWKFYKSEDHLLINYGINFSHWSPERATSRVEALFPLIAHGGQALLEHRDVFVNGKLFLSSTRKSFAFASTTCATKRLRRPEILAMALLSFFLFLSLYISFSANCYFTSFSLTFSWHVLICSWETKERTSEVPVKRKKVPSRVDLRIYVHTPRPSLLVINATERPLFSTRVCSRSTSPPGIDLRPRGRGLKSVTRRREKERERERGEGGGGGEGIVDSTFFLVEAEPRNRP